MKTAISLCHRILLTFLVIVSCTNNAIAIPINELEPNEANQSSAPLGEGQFGVGIISSGADYDGWVIQSVHATDRLFAYLSSIADNGDPVLSGYYTAAITDTINSNIYNDDGGAPAAGFSDSCFAGEPIKQTGALYLRVDGFGSSTINPYHLYQVVVAQDEFVNEITPNDTVQTAMPITAKAINGSGSSNPDFYSFFANAGERIVVLLNQDPARTIPASTFVAKMTLLSTDGVTNLAPAGGTFYKGPQSQFASAIGAVQAPSTGTYYVKIEKDPVTNGADGPYQLAVLVDGATPIVGACCNSVSCGQFSRPNCRGHFGGENTTCIGDTDGDGVPNDCDNCSQVANLSQEDDDGDEAGNSCDDCVTDKLKITVGSCGCNIPDTDSDLDGVADCIDACPVDKTKAQPGVCGCGVADVDANANGATDCLAGPELKAILSTVSKGLKNLSPLTGRESSKQLKVRATKIRNLKLLLQQINDRVKASSTQIATAANFNLQGQVSTFIKAANALLKADRGTFTTKKKKTAGLSKKIIGSIL